MNPDASNADVEFGRAVGAAAVAAILNAHSGEAADVLNERSAARVHTTVDAIRSAIERRAALGGAEFEAAPVEEAEPTADEAS